MPSTRGLPMGESVQFGWNTFRGNFGLVIAVTLAAWLVPTFIEWTGGRVLHHGPQKFAMVVIGLLVSSALHLGVIHVYIRLRDGEKPAFESLFGQVARVPASIGASIVAAVAIAMGLVLFIVPGIVFLLRLSFAGFVIVDDRAGPLEALQGSWDLTRGYTLDLFLFFILILALNILGAACLLVGLIVTLPVSGLAMAFVYRHFKPRMIHQTESSAG